MSTKVSAVDLLIKEKEEQLAKLHLQTHELEDTIINLKRENKIPTGSEIKAMLHDIVTNPPKLPK